MFGFKPLSEDENLMSLKKAADKLEESNRKLKIAADKLEKTADKLEESNRKLKIAVDRFINKKNDNNRKRT